MLTNTWVGSYWVGADGNWIPNYDPDQNAKWVQDGNTWYYQRTDGSRITNSWKRLTVPGIISPEAEPCSPDGTLWVAPGTSLTEVERCRQAGVRLTVPGI